MDEPAIEMFPRVGGISPTTILAMVDLPDPDSPTRANVFRWGIAKLTSATAVSVDRPARLRMRLSQGRDTSNWHQSPSTATIALALMHLPRGLCHAASRPLRYRRNEPAWGAQRGSVRTRTGSACGKRIHSAWCAVAASHPGFDAKHHCPDAGSE